MNKPIGNSSAAPRAELQVESGDSKLKNSKAQSFALRFLDVAIFGFSFLLVAVVLLKLITIFTQPTTVFEGEWRQQGTTGIDYVRHLMLSELGRIDPSKIYNLDAQVQWYSTHVSTALDRFSPPYYPPGIPLVFMPFTFLSYSHGFVVWDVLQIALTIFLCQKFFRSREKALDAVLFWILILASPSANQANYLGQTTFFQTAFFAAFYYGWKNDKSILAGIAIALFGIPKPQHCLIPFVMLAAKKDWRGILSFAVGSAGIYAASAAAFGINTVLGYPKFLSTVEGGSYARTVFWGPTDLCINIRGIIANYPDALGVQLDPKTLLHLSYASMVVVAVASYFIWKRALKLNHRFDGQAMFITLSLYFIFSPHANFYDLILLTVAFTISVSAVGLTKLRQLTSSAEKSWALAFIVFWFGSQLLCIVVPRAYSQNLHCVVIAAFSLFAFLQFKKNAPETAK